MDEQNEKVVKQLSSDLHVSTLLFSILYLRVVAGLETGLEAACRDSDWAGDWAACRSPCVDLG